MQNEGKTDNGKIIITFCPMTSVLQAIVEYANIGCEIDKSERRLSLTAI